MTVMTSISLPGATRSCFVRSVFTCFMLCIASVLSVMCCDNRLNRSCVADTHLGSCGRCSFRLTHLRSDFVKRLTFHSGSFLCISDGGDPKSKEISCQRPSNTYF